MVIILVEGHVLANIPVFMKLLSTLAGFAKEIARKVTTVDYQLLIARAGGSHTRMVRQHFENSNRYRLFVLVLSWIIISIGLFF